MTQYGVHDVARRADEPAKAVDTARSPFERDRARVLHSAAFRRLAAKTQVAGVGRGDFPRTRLTHSLECAQIGREIAAALGADPDLVDTACLAHDLGHPPFGHNGEAALADAAATCGGFEGNAQSLRVLVRLEAKVLDANGRPAGLNLTRASLDAATKYPWPPAAGERKYGTYADDRPAFDWVRAGAPQRARCLEASIMDWADDVAYSVHDLEDGVHAGDVDPALLHDRGLQGDVLTVTAKEYSNEAPEDLVSALGRLLAQPWWISGYDGSARSLVALKRTTSELIARFCRAAIQATRDRYGADPLRRYAAELVVPADVRAECAVLKGVTAHLVMQRPESLARQRIERDVVHELVAELMHRAPDGLDAQFRELWGAADGDAARRRVVVDQIASLTDTSALHLHSRLTGRAPLRDDVTFDPR